MASGHYMVMTAVRGNGREIGKLMHEKLKMDDQLKMDRQMPDRLCLRKNGAKTAGSEITEKLKTDDQRYGTIEGICLGANGDEKDPEMKDKLQIDKDITNEARDVRGKGHGEKVDLTDKSEVPQKDGFIDDTQGKIDQKAESNKDKQTCDTLAHCDIQDFSTGHGKAYCAQKTNQNVSLKSKSCDILPQNASHIATEHKLDRRSLQLSQNHDIPDPVLSWFHRFGHTVCQLGNKVLISGGFGELENGHCRIKDLLEYDLCSETVSISSGFTSLERMFATCTKLEDGRVCIFGGRLSPQKPCDTLVVLDEVDGGWNDEVDQIKDWKVLRWRHTATAVKLEGVYKFLYLFLNILKLHALPMELCCQANHCFFYESFCQFIDLITIFTKIKESTILLLLNLFSFQESSIFWCMGDVM